MSPHAGWPYVIGTIEVIRSIPVNDTILPRHTHDIATLPEKARAGGVATTTYRFLLRVTAGKAVTYWAAAADTLIQDVSSGHIADVATNAD